VFILRNRASRDPAYVRRVLISLGEITMQLLIERDVQLQQPQQRDDKPCLNFTPAVAFSAMCSLWRGSSRNGGVLRHNTVSQS